MPDDIRVALTVGTAARAERTIDVPDDLVAALTAAGVKAKFDALPFSHRREWIAAVLEAKREETRAKRIAACIDKILTR